MLYHNKCLGLCFCYSRELTLINSLHNKEKQNKLIIEAHDFLKNHT